MAVEFDDPATCAELRADFDRYDALMAKRSATKDAAQ